MTQVNDLKVFWVLTDVIFLLSVPTLVLLPSLSRIELSEPKLAPQDDAGDAGDRLEGVLGPNRCHILAQRANISHKARIEQD